MLKVAGGSEFLAAANESMTAAEQDQVRPRGPTPSMTTAPTLRAPTLTLALTRAPTPAPGPTLLPARP